MSRLPVLAQIFKRKRVFLNTEKNIKEGVPGLVVHAKA